MSNGREYDNPSRYQIRVIGHIANNWSDWFEGLAIEQEDDGTTVLTGTVADQTALYGLIIKMRDLNLILISIERVSVDQLLDDWKPDQ